MRRIIVELLLTGLSLFIGAYFVPGVWVKGLGTAIWVALLIALANVSLGAILRFFTFILNFLTLGLMSFIITVLMILLVDHWVEGFRTANFLSAAILAIVVAVVKALLDMLFGQQERK